jgi:lipopolysaccharide transport system permease protein
MSTTLKPNPAEQAAGGPLPTPAGRASPAGADVATLAPSMPPRPALVLRSETSLAARQRDAVTDVVDGSRLWRLAFTLGWLDIRLRYRGSVLGPFWLTLSTAVMVAALGVLYSTLFKMNLHEYLPFLALSLVLWGYIQTLVGDACQCFLQAEGLIRSVRMPFTLHAVRIVVRNVLTLGHNVVVIVAVWAIFDAWPGWDGMLAIPGVAVWLVDSLAVCVLLGTFCARFRDIPPIVASVMQIAFFVSPVIWKPDLLQGESARWLPANPFFALLEIVRAPLLHEVPTTLTWVSALGYSAALCVLAWAVFARLRSRLAFWV